MRYNQIIKVKRSEMKLKDAIKRSLDLLMIISSVKESLSHCKIKSHLINLSQNKIKIIIFCHLYFQTRLETMNTQGLLSLYKTKLKLEGKRLKQNSKTSLANRI